MREKIISVVVLVILILVIGGCGNAALNFTANTPSFLEGLDENTVQDVSADKDYPVPNKVNVRVHPTASFDKISEKTTYQYTLTSLKDSQQIVEAFSINFNKDNSFLLENIENPNYWHWSDFYDAPTPGGDWFCERTTLDHPPYYKPIHGIMPGQSQAGFSFTSNALPEIGEVYLGGWVRLWAPQGEAGWEGKPIKPIPTFPENHFKTQTIIPFSAPPATFDFSAFQTRMNGFINRAAELGWISSAPVKADLLSRFAKVTGINQTSLKALAAFLAALESYHGKGVNDSAYYLLKVNSQYLQNRLEGKAIPRWPNLKKEKVKDPVSEADPCIDKMAKIAEKINNSRYLENKGKGPDARQIAGRGYRCPVTGKMYRIQMYQLYIYPHSFNFTLSCTGAHPGYETGYPQVASHDTTLSVLKSGADLKNVPGR